MFRTSDFSRAALLPLWLAAAPLPALAQKNDTKAARFYEDALVRYEKKDLPGAIIQLKNALQIDKNMLPVHASCDTRFTPLARWLLYVRSHWLRMPWYRITPHLLRKGWMRALERYRQSRKPKGAAATV